jgi:hypothetical protein
MQKHFHLLEEASSESIAEFVAIDMETEDAVGLPFAYKCLRSAEQAMVNWALEAIKKHSQQDFDQIEYLRREAKMYPDVWDKLVSIAFRYSER